MRIELPNNKWETIPLSDLFRLAREGNQAARSAVCKTISNAEAAYQITARMMTRDERDRFWAKHSELVSEADKLPHIGKTAKCAQWDLDDLYALIDSEDPQ